MHTFMRYEINLVIIFLSLQDIFLYWLHINLNEVLKVFEPPQREYSLNWQRKLHLIQRHGNMLSKWPALNGSECTCWRMNGSKWGLNWPWMCLHGNLKQYYSWKFRCSSLCLSAVWKIPVDFQCLLALVCQLSGRNVK